MKKMLLTLCLLPLATPVFAQDYLTGSLGWFDLVDGENEATHLGAEYRFHPLDYGVRPTIGASITTDGSVYGYGGFNWDIEVVPNQFFLIPNFMAGLYAEGDGKDLGHTIEFRSGVEFAYQMPNAHRVGLAFNHISNAGIGNKNPGAETLMLTYSLPMGTMR
jgi:lipid A 3-O-deacylase